MSAECCNSRDGAGQVGVQDAAWQTDEEIKDLHQLSWQPSDNLGQWGDECKHWLLHPSHGSFRPTDILCKALMGCPAPLLNRLQRSDGLVSKIWQYRTLAHVIPDIACGISGPK